MLVSDDPYTTRYKNPPYTQQTTRALGQVVHLRPTRNDAQKKNFAAAFALHQGFQLFQFHILRKLVGECVTTL